MATVDFDRLKAQYEKEIDEDYDLTDEEFDEMLRAYPKDTPEAYAKIGYENFFD
jgi:hypothetical protein